MPSIETVIMTVPNSCQIEDRGMALNVFARIGRILLCNGLLTCECKLALRCGSIAYLLQIFMKRLYRLSS